MLAIKPSKTTPSQVTPNILPCRVAHTGTLPASQAYWKPVSHDISAPSTNTTRVSKQQTQRAYFRGRRLLGRQIPLHPGYRGLVVRSTGETIADSSAAPPPEGQDQDEDEDDDANDEEEPVKALETVAAFDHVVVWGHDSVPGDDEAMVRGLSEWIGLAESMHDFDGAENWWKGKAAETP